MSTTSPAIAHVLTWTQQPVLSRIQFVGMTTNTNTNGGGEAPLDLSEPPGVIQDDLVFAAIACRMNAVQTIGIPAGWTRLAEQLNNNIVVGTNAVPCVLLAGFRRGPTAPSYQFSWNVMPTPALSCTFAYRGLQNATFLSATNSGGSTSAVNLTNVTWTTNLTSTGINPGTLVVAVVAGGQDATWTNFRTSDAALAINSGTNQLEERRNVAVGQWFERRDSQSVLGNKVSLAIYDAIRGSNGVIGTPSAIASVASGHAIAMTWINILNQPE